MGDAVESYTLDAQERVESVTNLEGQSLDVTYLVGDLVSSVDRFDGVLVSNIFDNAGNVTETLHDGVSIEQASYRMDSCPRSVMRLPRSTGAMTFAASPRMFSLQSAVYSCQSVTVTMPSAASLAFCGMLEVERWMWPTAMMKRNG